MGVTTNIFAQNSSLPSYGQTVLPPSPEAATLARFIDYPVSLSSGLPQIDIPIYTFKSRQLSVPISLSYHAGGIKVSDRAQIMGAGWTINAGGAITRSVRDLPDEGLNGFLYQSYFDEATDPQAYYKSFCLASQLVDAPYIQGATKIDGEPDLFYYDYLGKGGKFIYRNMNAGLPVTIPYTPIKITGGGPFILTDEQGNTYQFGNYSPPLAQDYYSQGNSLITNTWYLTQMISADRTDTISFSYEQCPTDYVSQVTHKGVDKIDYNGNILSRFQILTGSNNYSIQSVRLKEIDCVNGKVVFSYGGGGVANVRSLSNIDVYDNQSNHLRSFALYQSQFNNCNRPRLDEVASTGYQHNTASPNPLVYRFNYTTTDAPPIDSFDQDFWGFYNGKGNTNMLCASPDYATGGFDLAPGKRMADSASMIKGMLRTITYPTSGSTTFSFQPNQITYTGTTTTTTSGNSIDHEIFTANPLDPSITPVVTLNFTATSSASSATLTSSVYTNSNYTSSSTSRPVVTVKDLATGNTIATAVLLVNNTYSTGPTTVFLAPGHNYQLQFTPYSYGSDVRVLADLVENIPTVPITQHIYAGGLRVQQIVHNDGNGNTIIKTYNYTKPYFNSNYFAGDFNALAGRFHTIIGFNGMALGISPMLIQNADNYVEGLNIGVGGASNTSVSYQQVEEVQSSTYGNILGKTIYSFNQVYDEVPNWFPYFRSDRDFLRGQLLEKKTYQGGAANLILIQDIINTYSNIGDNYTLDSKGTDSVKFYQAYDYYDWQRALAMYPVWQLSPPAYTSAFAGAKPCPICPVFDLNLQSMQRISPFYYHVTRPLLMSTATTNYDSNGLNPVTSQVSYYYNNMVHVQPSTITTVNSKQQTKTQNILYPLDPSIFAPPGLSYNQLLPPGQAIYNMRLQNIITPKLSTATQTNGINTDFLQTIFTSIPGANSAASHYQIIRPQSILTSTGTNPLEQRMLFNYDGNGNLIGQNKPNGPVTAYQWGYNNQYTTAEAINATSNDIFYDSFEEGDGNSTAGIAKTGHYSYNITTIPYTHTLNNIDPGNYTLSYWQLGANNNWALVSNNVTIQSGTTTYTISIPSGQIDDVRFYPANAQMKTFTYDRLIGITSETDSKNETIYYEYDGFQRLLDTKDQNGHILKSFDYHYVQQ